MSHVFASKTDPSVTPSPELAAKCREFDTQIGASGDTPRLLVWTGAAPPTLEEAQTIVGGYVTLLELPNGEQLLLNEDANLKKMRANPEACQFITNLDNRYYRNIGAKFGGYPVMGTALILVADARWS